ncbi:MAG TPA: hypothetical protein EYQ05_16285 [Gammaproteobacteria bacterium]|nr:hypothetical protein [Gammaproteobacteria bacterium]
MTDNKKKVLVIPNIHSAGIELLAARPDVDYQILESQAPKAISQIQSLAEKAESENVRLKANADLLDRAGWKPVDKQEITETSAIEDMSDEELQAQLDSYFEAEVQERGMKLVQA